MAVDIVTELSVMAGNAPAQPSYVSDLNKRAANEIRRLRSWEEFGRCVLERFCEGDSQIEMLDVQEWAENAGCLVSIPGGFDPGSHIDVTGASEAGDPFYQVAPKSVETEAT